MSHVSPVVQDGLQVTYLPMEGATGKWNDPGDEAFRVAYGWEGELYAQPVPFVRRRDAELALRALGATGLFYGSPREIVWRAKSQGWSANDVRRIMLEALEW